MSNRPIDIYEDAICAALDLHDRLVYESDDAVPFAYAVQVTAQAHGLTEERLAQLIRMWCALAGIEVPA